MLEIFKDSRYSINHAQRRIAEFETESIAFAESNPYAFITEMDGDGINKIHKVKLTKPMPPALSGIAFDAISNLRAALDQAGHACAVAKGSPGDNAKFPFGDMAKTKNFESCSARDMPKEIFDVMASFQPYKGGNDLLYALNLLCNSQKHKIVIPVCFSAGRITGSNIVLSGNGILLSPAWDRTKNEMVLFRGTGNFTYDNLEITGFIAMAQVDTVDGKPALAVLNELLRIVSCIIDAIEAEAIRINLISSP